jgi:hypothetical protein
VRPGNEIGLGNPRQRTILCPMRRIALTIGVREGLRHRTLDTGETNAGAEAPEPVVREWRCVACGHVTEFRWTTGGKPPRWGPECRRCREVTGLVPVAGDARDMAAPLLALLRSLLHGAPENGASRPSIPAQRLPEPARAAPAPAEMAAPASKNVPIEPAAPGPAPDGNAAQPMARTDPPASRKSARPDRPARMPGPMLIMTEFFYTRRASRRLLHLYETVHREHPKHGARALYEEVVVRWSDVDVPAARAILRRAAQSFVDWDSDRDLRFRDVVIYLVADDYVRAHPERHGARSRMARTAARTIPREI